MQRFVPSIGRVVARSGNLGGLVVLGGDNVSPLVEIGLTDLRTPPLPPPLKLPALRNGLIMSEMDPLNHKWLDIMI